MLRIAVALLVLFALTAFAPAPFPKVRRNNDTTTLQSCQGLWTVDQFHVANNQGQLTRSEWGVTHIRISDDRWTLLRNGNVLADVYRIVIDGSKSPAHIDWVSRNGGNQTPAFVGIVKRQGNQVRITYLSGSTNRAKSFENMPSGTCLVTAHK